VSWKRPASCCRKVAPQGGQRNVLGSPGLRNSGFCASGGVKREESHAQRVLTKQFGTGHVTSLIAQPLSMSLEVCTVERDDEIPSHTCAPLLHPHLFCDGSPSFHGWSDSKWWPRRHCVNQIVIVILNWTISECGFQLAMQLETAPSTRCWTTERVSMVRCVSWERVALALTSLVARRLGEGPATIQSVKSSRCLSLRRPQLPLLPAAPPASPRGLTGLD
jgi:hypothetical protein